MPVTIGARSMPWGRWALAVIVALSFAFTIRCAYERARIPFAINYEEGNILNAGVRVLHGQTPYPDPGAFPYILNPYGPVGYLLTALSLRLAGLSLLGPRLLVLLAGLGIWLVIALLTKRMGGLLPVGFLMGTLYLCEPVSRVWYPVLRVDYWAILLSLLGLYVFVGFPRAWPAAPALMALALLTKHTTVSAPMVCLADLLLVQRRPKRAAGFFLVLAGIGSAPLILMGPAFRFHLFQTHPDPYSFRQALELYSWAVEGSLLPLAVICYTAARGVRWEGSRLMMHYAAACSGVALTAGKLGSDTNHFLEWSAAICMLAGLALSHLLATHDSTGRLLAAGLVILTAFLGLRFRLSTAIRPDQGGCAGAYDFVGSFPGERVLSEDVAALVLNRKAVLVSNPFVTTQLRDTVNWSQGSMEHLVEERYFDLVLLGGDVEGFLPQSGRWAASLIRAVGERYKPERRFECFPYLGVAYVPK